MLIFYKHLSSWPGKVGILLNQEQLPMFRRSHIALDFIKTVTEVHYQKKKDIADNLRTLLAVF